jgi:nicotinamidase-related amidase
MMVTKYLLVIDMQNVFADPKSGWFTPEIDQIYAPIQRLVKHFSPHVIFTRFISAKRPQGAWRTYYHDWPETLVPPSDAIWEIVPQLQELSRSVHGWNGDATTIDKTTFGKDGPELQALLAPDDEIYLCGVSSDCCVLSTATALIDRGIKTFVIEDACRASNPEALRAAMLVIGDYEPISEIVNSEQVLVQK